MEAELRELIKAAKEFKEYQSIGNGAKLNCAIEDAELRLQKPIKTYTEKDMIAFGNYIRSGLSKEEYLIKTDDENINHFNEKIKQK